MTEQETRNKVADYWKESGIKKVDEFAFLTNNSYYYKRYLS